MAVNEEPGLAVVQGCRTAVARRNDGYDTVLKKLVDGALENSPSCKQRPSSEAHVTDADVDAALLEFYDTFNRQQYLGGVRSQTGIVEHPQSVDFGSRGSPDHGYLIALNDCAVGSIEGVPRHRIEKSTVRTESGHLVRSDQGGHKSSVSSVEPIDTSIGTAFRFRYDVNATDHIVGYAVKLRPYPRVDHGDDHVSYRVSHGVKFADTRLGMVVAIG